MDLYTHDEQFQEALGRLTEEGRYQDTLLVCQDESVRTCRLLLALAFPLLDKVLEGRHLEEEICILLPEHTSEDINIALNQFFTNMSSFSKRTTQQESMVNDMLGGDHIESPYSSICKQEQIEKVVDLREEHSEPFTNMSEDTGNDDLPNLRKYEDEFALSFEDNPSDYDDKAKSELEVGDNNVLVEDNNLLVDDTTTFENEFTKPIGEIYETPQVDNSAQEEGEEPAQEVEGTGVDILNCDICNNTKTSRGNLERHKLKMCCNGSQLSVL
jgi:hypothetical protein